MYARIHQFWETHELLSEFIVASVGIVLVGALTMSSLWSRGSTQPLSLSVVESPVSLVDMETKDPLPQAKSARGTMLITDTRADDANVRIAIEQEIVKTDQALTRIKNESVALVSLIARECRSQENACAKEKQAELDVSATTYNTLQERLKALTASLGNLR